MFEAVTESIRVQVSARYLEGDSDPQASRYVFAYTIRITNESQHAVQLHSRHWRILHGNGKREEVRGLGVVGEQPVLEPGAGFQYTSGCVLSTPHGTMEGTYEMFGPTGEPFDVRIPAFSLAMPHALN